MYAVEVSDHIMIAHSFKGEVFGPAQALHGATFTVAVAFMSEKLDPNGIVVDIGCAIDVLKALTGNSRPAGRPTLSAAPEAKLPEPQHTRPLHVTAPAKPSLYPMRLSLIMSGEPQVSRNPAFAMAKGNQRPARAGGGRDGFCAARQNRQP